MPATGLPSIADFVRALSDIEEQGYEHDNSEATSSGLALRDLIATLEPSTLEDAAVVLACAVIEIGGLSILEELSSDAHAKVVKIERMMLCALSVAVRAAVIDSNTWFWQQIEETRSRLLLTERAKKTFELSPGTQRVTQRICEDIVSSTKNLKKTDTILISWGARYSHQNSFHGVP